MVVCDTGWLPVNSSITLRTLSPPKEHTTSQQRTGHGIEDEVFLERDSGDALFGTGYDAMQGV